MRNNKSLVSTIVKVGAAVAGLAFAISGISFGIGIAQKAMVLFSAASKFALGPVGALIGAIGSGIYLYKQLSSAVTSVATSEQLATSVRERALDASIDQRVEVMQLFETMKKAKQGSEAYTSALSAIEQMQPGITEKYNLQEKSVRALSAAEKDLTNNIMKRAMEEAKAEMLKEEMKGAMERKAKGATWTDDLIAMGINSYQPIMQAFGADGFNKQFSGQDVVDTDVNNRMQNAQELGKMNFESANPQNSENKDGVKEVRLIINGNDIGTLGGLGGKQTEVPAFGRLTPKTSTTR
jgi:hypothetical protein